MLRISERFASLATLCFNDVIPIRIALRWAPRGAKGDFNTTSDQLDLIDSISLYLAELRLRLAELKRTHDDHGFRVGA